MVVLVIGGSVRWSGKSPNSTAVLHLDGHLALHRQSGAKFHHLHGRYQEGISRATLAKWRAEARLKGRFFPDAKAGPEGWTSRDKHAAVIETASMNEADLGGYCRRRGIYPEQLRVWREACERANDWERAAARRITRETKDASPQNKAKRDALNEWVKAINAAGGFGRWT